VTALTKAVSSYTNDTIAPTLKTFGVDLNESTLSLVFDEPIKAATLSVTSIIVSSDNSSAPSVSYNLTGGNTSSSDGLEIVISLSLSDANAIKAELGLLVTEGSSFVSMLAGTVADMAGNEIAVININSGVEATSFVGDAGNPTLNRFDLNMTSGRLSLYFSETMDTSSLNLTMVTLQSAEWSSESQQHNLLSNGTVVTAIDTTTIDVDLSDGDLDEIKGRLIGTSVGSTWLVLEEGAVADTSNVSVLARANGVNALNVNAYADDSVPPELLLFDLNVTSGIMHLSFSELIDKRTFNTLGLQLLDFDATNATGYNLTSTSLVCAFCGTGYFETAECTRENSTVCQECTACNSSQYYIASCNSTADATCSSCSSCSTANEYISGPCTGFQDTVCSNCTTCGNHTFLDSACNSTHDAVCTSCTLCAANEYMISSCNATHNTVCQAHSASCSNVEYTTAVGTDTDDIQCTACSSCGADQFELISCGDSSDTICANCTQPEVGLEYITQSCNITADNALDVCAVCTSATEYQKSVCQNTTDSVCDTCTECGNGTYTSERCSRTSDTECSNCTDDCDVCGSANSCVACTSGSVRNTDATCTDTCADGSYQNGTYCHVCHAECNKCNGPLASDCLTCSGDHGYTFDTISGACAKVDACEDLQNSTRYYLQQSGGTSTCQQCDAACATCWGGTSTECSTCYDGKFSAGFGCYDACPDGYFAVNGQYKCHQCAAHCAECSEAEVCTSCDDGFYLVDGVCVEVCPLVTSHGTGI